MVSPWQQFIDNNHQLMNGHKWNTILEYLKTENLVNTTAMNSMHTAISLTPEGLKFINEGGLTAEDRYKAETLWVAKKSKIYAFWALVVSVLGVLVSLLLWFLGDRK